jgi:hypothetical protein
MSCAVTRTSSAAQVAARNRRNLKSVTDGSTNCIDYRHLAAIYIGACLEEAQFSIIFTLFFSCNEP